MVDDETRVLVEALESKRGGPGVRAQAARMLGEHGDPESIEPLLRQIEDTADPFRVPVVTAVLDALPRFGESLTDPLERLLEDKTDFRRRYVPRLLFSAIGEGAAPILITLLDDSDDEVVMNAVTALGSLHQGQFASVVHSLVEDTTRPPLVRGVAASALGMTGDSTAYETLVSLLASDDPSLLAGAIDGLAELGDWRAVPLLQALLARGPLAENVVRGAKLALISLQSRR